MRWLAVTMGSSLFHSATWRPEGPFAEIPGYRVWTEEPLVRSPRKRSQMCRPLRRGQPLQSGQEVERRVEELLRGEAPDALADLVAADGVTCPGRYCAELATLLGLISRDDPGLSLGDFLRRYDHVEILAAEHSEDPSHHAGRHFQAALEALIGKRCSTVKALRGETLPERLKAFQAYLRAMPGTDAVDLLVSGGFKAFATVAGRHLPGHPSWRTVYQHEDSTDVVIEDYRGLVIEGRRLDIELGNIDMPAPQ